MMLQGRAYAVERFPNPFEGFVAFAKGLGLGETIHRGEFRVKGQCPRGIAGVESFRSGMDRQFLISCGVQLQSISFVQMRGRSYTPSPPPRSYSRRGRSPVPRGRHGGRGDAPTSLLVRNLRRDCRAEDLKKPFGQFGDVKDIYLPRDYHTREPRGFGFIQYVDPADAAEAKYQMDGQLFQGREITVVFAEENRKKPTEMRARERGGRGRAYDRRRSPPRYSRSPPRYGRSPSHSRDHYSPRRRGYSRSVSPRRPRYSRERSYSRSPAREQSPPYNGPRDYSASPVRERSPAGSRSRSQSPARNRSPDRARSPSRSRSPYPPAEYSRGQRRARSPSQ
ncbi:Serine/arginine-rich SC35-like splicing factor SCL30A [Striga hermonthica]|uniref:Serine/arginine-rich SC35-like splicing factor SCL30A n=1 Tax=Striga hermonthica TaxID=68872 RepID=A0A9N7RA47_STRHE|nr:Serine/arginine-rich SC35-like splicing factor SCL30A [Striga hermonthica]